MPVFEYKGYDAKGKNVKGVHDADSIKALRMLLRKEGILATFVVEAASGKVVAQAGGGLLNKQIRLDAFFKRIPAQDIANTTRQMAVLLQAGVPVVESLNALLEQIENEPLQRVFSEVRSSVNEGSSLADALARHSVFSPIYINMVRAGESSGALEVVLERLADLMERQTHLNSKIMGAMAYPAVMALVSVLVMMIMLTTVVPRISQIFLRAKVKLPATTSFLIWVSDVISGFWWLLLILLGGAIYAFIRWKKTPQGRAKWDSFKMRVPVFGQLVQLVAVARFSRTLSTLLAGGVPLLNSLQIVRNIVNNDVLEKAIDDVREAVREGEDIAAPLKRAGCFPPMVTHMISIGEKSGELESMLTRIATTYEQQVEVKVTTLTSLLEPIMIVVMGVSVGFIVFSILTPIMQMSQLVQ
ncbi:MAG: type II secretion system inner membrane protein GspF [Deltaproteobacteria bacterium]|nr:type II secretion system inner membrane protein GspF [Deltaproteobacteria bacterium]